MTLPRLSLSTWFAREALGLPDGVTGPGFDPRDLGVGQVHLGIGAFHRAHQEVCTSDAIEASGDSRWGVLGVTQRSARVVDQLGPQDGLSGVMTLGRNERSLRVVGAMRAAAFPGTDTPRVVAAIAAPTTHVVTLTVTEKGYRRGPAGDVDMADDDSAADLAALARPYARHHDERPCRTPVGLLLRGLAARARADAGPLTVVCCDNLSDNGGALRTLIHSWIDHLPSAPRLRPWLDEQVRFPATMVDRIVPATAPVHRERAAALLGLRDEGLVIGEPFLQWVISDDFAAARPPWELGGAIFTDDVRPFERAKLRVLNGAHSTLAYLGALRGHATIAGAVADPHLAGIVRQLLDEDVMPTLAAPRDLDLTMYRERVLERFANPRAGHLTVQVAMDGSQKLPQRLLDTARDRLAAGALPTGVAHAVAGWIAYVRAASAGDLFVDGRVVELEDPMAPALAEATSGPLPGVVDKVFALQQIFGDDLPQAVGFRAAVAAALRGLAT
ncbi:MAG TPA: mannitol dehydrogenase family protein [Cellulomonas sp.]